MASNYISNPGDFKHMEGNSVDFRKTFNLNGTENDEMLRLYLRKAGLSDEIECLTAEQRRAFIYDIIKSNKMPGYWMPSTMKTSSSFSVTPPAVRPPPPPTPIRSLDTPSTPYSSPYTERKNSAQYPSMSTSSSTGSLQSLQGVGIKSSPIVPRRFVAAPDKPPSPSTFVTTSKGSRFEISGPMNFHHIAGDMTRDMTRNAFDLTLTMNDNVLKKYLIERGILEEDVSGMRKTDLIRNIVQSKFTWVPPKRITKAAPKQPNIVYATISRNCAKTPPPSPQPSIASSSSSSSYTSCLMASATNATVQPMATPSNFTLITARFADPSEFPTPEDLFGNKPQNEITPPVHLPPLPASALRPAPPPRKPKEAAPPPPPPPPSTITATSNSYNIYHSNFGNDKENYYEAMPPNMNNFKTRPPPPPSINEMLYAGQTKHKVTTATVHAPTPPPPPPPPMAVPMSAYAPPAAPPPPPLSNIAVIANPPLPKISLNNNSIIPPPPPTATALPKISSNNYSAGPPPPPPPPMSMLPPMKNETPKTSMNAVNKSAASSNNVGGDPRDAFLESIRAGVALKKVNQKAATISGVKPRTERKPPAMDLISELKMGITLKRVKNPIDNPFSGDEPDESHA